MVGKDGHAEADRFGSAVGRGSTEAVELGSGGVETDLASFGFSEPAVATGFADAFAEALDDLDEPWPLAAGDLENLWSR
ncbi:hypothetical protein [Streptomyces sp. NPDC002403]